MASLQGPNPLYIVHLYEMGKINIIKKKGHFVYFYYSRSFNFYTLVPNFVQFLHFSYKNAYINLNYHKLNNKDFK